MDEVNRQRGKKKVITQETVVVDPRMTTSPFSPKGKSKNRTQVRQESTRGNQKLKAEDAYRMEKLEDSPNVDHEAHWF